jgi:hypothetical protein
MAAMAAGQTIHLREGGGTGYVSATFDDTYLYISPANDTTYGNSSYDGIQVSASKVSLLAVKDLFTALPATSGGADLEITSATLHLFRYNAGSSSVTISVYPMLTDWLPDSAGTNENDCSAIYSENSSSTTWCSGNFSSADYDDGVVCTGPWVDAYNGECEIDVTGVIQAIYDNGTNYGMLIDADGSIIGRASEHTIDYRPSLEIAYEYVAADVTEGLVSRYTFDSDASDCVGDNDGTLSGGASIVSDGERGYVLSLDGTDDYVDLPTSGLTGGRSEATLSMWVKPDETTSTNTIWDEHNNWYWQFSLLQSTWATRDSSTGTTGGRNNDLAYSGLGSGDWKHLAVVYSVTAGTKEIYIDGESVTSTDVSVDALTSDRSGAYIGNASDGDNFDGMIDDVRLYSRALSEEEIGILAAGGSTPPDTYTLTVNSGSGDGDYEEDEEVEVSADSAPSGQVFDGWSGDTAGLADSGGSTTTMTMPAADATITAIYTDILYALTVNSGSGDGDYTPGTNVNISADTPPAHMEFDCWIGNTANVDDVDDPTTSITMPGSNATITATYTNVLYTLTVNSGSGDGSYAYGTNVNISADGAPAHMEFDCWIGSTANVDDVDDPTTSITMPGANATITATYTDILYTLTVNSGNGDGSYAYGTNVNISADAAASGYEFDEWTGYTAGIADVEDPTTTVTMPASSTTVTATYAEAGPTTTLIVNWGDSAGNNVYDFSDWSTPYIGQYTSYSSTGPDGLMGGWTGTGDSGAVSGSSQAFSSGDQITVTWYNSKASALTFTPKVSFDDPDKYGSGTAGTWYDMSQVQIAADDTGTTTYTFDGGTAGNYSLVNVCRFTNDCEEIVMDKIELVGEGGGGPTYYTLTVNSGSGDGDYTASTVVNISANAAASGYTFDDWVGNTSGIADVDDPTTTLTMPAANQTITATYNAVATYTLTVNSGSGDGSYAASTVVDIDANAAASGYTFDDWIGNTSGIANVNASSTTLTMPAANQTITATYEAAGSGPAISSTSGTITHGSSVTISGSGFGTKATAAPFKYDDFEAGTLDARVGNGWYTTSSTSGYWPIYADDYRRASGLADQSAYLQHDVAYNSTIGVTGLNWGYGRDAYISAWYYCETAGAASRNFKIFGWRGGGAGDWDGPDLRVDMYPTTNSGHAYIARPDKSLIVQDWGIGGNVLEGGWHRVEMYVHTGTSSGGDNDGVCIGWRDLDEWWTLQNFEYDFSTQDYDNIYFASYFARDAGSPTPQMWWYYDEIYIDTTQARVEIGNASTWSGCSHREIQVPTSWSSGSVTVDVNQGTFSDGAGAYLYVVDADGNVNSNGYGIEFDD